MTTRDYFRQMLRERRQYARGSLDWEAKTRAARKYLFIIRKVPTNQWPLA